MTDRQYRWAFGVLERQPGAQRGERHRAGTADSPQHLRAGEDPVPQQGRERAVPREDHERHCHEHPAELREVFGFEYDEIAAATEKKPEEVPRDRGGVLRGGCDRPGRAAVGAAGPERGAPGRDDRRRLGNGQRRGRLVLYLDGELDAVGTVVAEDGKVVEIYLVRNPEKLAGVDVRREVRR